VVHSAVDIVHDCRVLSHKQERSEEMDAFNQGREYQYLVDNGERKRAFEAFKRAFEEGREYQRQLKRANLIDFDTFMGTWVLEWTKNKK